MVGAVLAVLATLACVLCMPTAPRDLVAIHGQVAVGGGATSAHLPKRQFSDRDAQRLQRRADNSNTQPFSMWPTRPAPTLADTMAELGLHANDLGAHPIASFRHLRQALFPRTLDLRRRYKSSQASIIPISLPSAARCSCQPGRSRRLCQLDAGRGWSRSDARHPCDTRPLDRERTSSWTRSDPSAVPECLAGTIPYLATAPLADPKEIINRGTRGLEERMRGRCIERRCVVKLTR